MMTFYKTLLNLHRLLIPSLFVIATYLGFPVSWSYIEPIYLDTVAFIVSLIPGLVSLLWLKDATVLLLVVGGCFLVFEMAFRMFKGALIPTAYDKLDSNTFISVEKSVDKDNFVFVLRMIQRSLLALTILIISYLSFLPTGFFYWLHVTFGVGGVGVLLLGVINYISAFQAIEIKSSYNVQTPEFSKIAANYLFRDSNSDDNSEILEQLDLLDKASPDWPTADLIRRKLLGELSELPFQRFSFGWSPEEEADFHQQRKNFANSAMRIG